MRALSTQRIPMRRHPHRSLPPQAGEGARCRCRCTSRHRLAACDLIETPSRMALFRMRSGDRSIAFAICSRVFLDLASSTRRRSSLKDQDFRAIAKKLPLQTSCNLQINYKMSTQAVSRSPKSIKGSLKNASAASRNPSCPGLVRNVQRQSAFC